MSAAEYTNNNDGMECPYCGHLHHVESESYDDNEHIEECDNCGKKFYAAEEFSVAHVARPDCNINDMDHDWHPFKLTDGSYHDFCESCGKCRSIGEK